MEALVRRVKVVCARSGSCACVYIGCACVLYICVLCGYVCQCGVCTCVGTRGWHQASSSFLLPHPIFWDSLSLSLELINSTSCLTGELQGSACLCSLRPGVPQCLCGCWAPNPHACTEVSLPTEPSPALISIPVVLKLHYLPVSHAHVAMHPFMSA